MKQPPWLLSDGWFAGYCDYHPTDTLGSKFGVEVVQHVMHTAIELMDKNGSGRYPVSELWHNKEQRVLRLDEVLETYIDKCHEFHDRMNQAYDRLAGRSGKKKGSKKKKK